MSVTEEPQTQGAAPAQPASSKEASPLKGLVSLIRTARREGREPLENYGWFGPDSVARRVWSYPTVATIGFSRAVVVEELDPFLVATVKQSSKIYSQARVRYARTVRYFATLAFSDSKTIAHAADVLIKVHSRASSPEPVSGLLSDPNNPDEQLWIHITGWHSVLYAYELFGPGKLSPADEDRYWAECAIAAEAQTIDTDKLPRNREEVRDYFNRMRPRLAASEATQEAMAHLMSADVALPEVPLYMRPGALFVSWAIRHAVISSLPRYQRELGNVDHPLWMDVAIRPLMRVTHAAVNANTELKLALLGVLAPGTVGVAGPTLRGIEPLSDEVLTPEQTWARHGVTPPREAYEELKQDQSTILFSPSAPLTPEQAEVWAVPGR
ncbi:MAG: DUF2236 domain-containing protein [Solirubrobacterales bacterium]|nr:DUF2236 domain-containing protein [Solirubrobacterales bacterium]